MGDLVVYAFGLCHASVCAPRNLTREQVVYEANQAHPTGLDHGWAISEEKHFTSGQPNPCVCNTDAERLHYLLVC